MDQTDRFECVSQQREPEPRITLRARSGGKTRTLDAAALLAQYAVSEADTLLVLDEDCPYEEQMHLVLVRDARVIDHISIGMMYMSGIFKAVETQDRQLRFTFESDVVWTLSIEAKGRRVFGALPRGARRHGGFLCRRYMFLDYGDGA